jgi:DNA mismatch endonuclease (patch repair protein)
MIPQLALVSFTMGDIYTAARRSQLMRCVRSKGNRTTELPLAAALRAAGITGWRRHVRLCVRTSGKGQAIGSKSVRITPDFLFRGSKVAVFIDGCFWHRCPVHGSAPQSRMSFWRKKLAGNVARDMRNTKLLRKAGWHVIRFWEHNVKNNLNGCITTIRRATS